MEKSKEKDHLLGQMEALIQEIFMKTIFMAKVSINGQMVEYIKEHGQTIRCMDMAYLLGLMVEGTKVSIVMIKNMGRVLSNGQMVENM